MSLHSIIFSSSIFVLCCISCIQKPEAQKFAAPKLGELKIELNDFSVCLKCAVTGEGEWMDAGFIFGKKFGEADRDTLVISILDGEISCSFDNLEPNTSYSVQAFVRSGQNEILSPEEVFTTRSINIAKDVKSITLPATDPGEYTLVLHGRNELGYWTTPSDSVECGFIVSFDHKNPSIDTEEARILRFTLPCSQKEYSLKLNDLDLDLPVYFRSYLIADGNYTYGVALESHTLETIDFNFRNIQIEPLGPSSIKVTGILEYNLHDPVDESLCIYAYAGNDIEKARNGSWTEFFHPDEEHHNFSHVFEKLDSETDLYLSLHAGFIDHEFKPTEPILFRTLSEKDFGEPVDLGLSVLWRSCNIGARIPEEKGDHFKWGARNIAAEGWWSDEFADYSTEPWTYKYNLLGKKTTLDLEDDIAHIKLGGKWRMPTAAEVDELLNNCKSQRLIVNGTDGFVLTSCIQGFEDKSIFLPINGGHLLSSVITGTPNDPHDFPEWMAYWTSTLISGDIYNPFRSLSFYSYDSIVRTGGENVGSLCGVRPVLDR